MKIGDKVRIIDGSQAHRMDKYEQFTSIGRCEDVFEVIYVEPLKYETKRGVLHDIHIRNLKTGAVYLHSSRMVAAVGRRRVLDQVRLMRALTEEGYIPALLGFSAPNKVLNFDNRMWMSCGEDIDETLHLGNFAFKMSWTEEY